MSQIALIFAGLRSMRFLWTMNPKKFPDDTPNAHFKRFILGLYCPQYEHYPQIVNILANFLRFGHYIINTILKTPVKHILKNDGHDTLISGAYILEAKKHDRVIKIAYV